MIFLFPLAFSVAGTIMFMLQDVAVGAKLLMLAFTSSAVFLQFFVGVHFLIPLALELIVCIWLAIWWQLE